MVEKSHNHHSGSTPLFFTTRCVGRLTQEEKTKEERKEGRSIVSLSFQLKAQKFLTAKRKPIVHLPCCCCPSKLPSVPSCAFKKFTQVDPLFGPGCLPSWSSSGHCPLHCSDRQLFTANPVAAAKVCKGKKEVGYPMLIMFPWVHALPRHVERLTTRLQPLSRRQPTNPTQLWHRRCWPHPLRSQFQCFRGLCAPQAHQWREKLSPMAQEKQRWRE